MKKTKNNESQIIGEFKQNCVFKNVIYGLLLFSLIIGLSGGVSACCDTGGGTCYTCGQTITQSCTMNASLNSTGTCFTIGADSLVINGDGYSITGDTSGY